MSETKAGPPNPSRRKFIKGLAAVAAVEIVSAAGLGTGPIGHLGEYLTSLAKLPEGNITQRLGRFERLAHLVAQEPSEENKYLAAAWVKFNLAEVYAASSGLPLSSQLAKHFLYGLGETVDISERYKKIILSEAANPPPQSQEVADDLISGYFEFNLNAAPSLHLVNREDMKSIHERRAPSVLALRALVQSETRDLRTALHSHTVSISGQTKRADERIADTAITLDNPTFAIYDRYDWEDKIDGPGVDINTHQAAIQFLTKLGVDNPEKKLADMLGEQNVTELTKHGWRLSDREGAVLAQRGFAREFDVRANISSSKPINLTIRNR